MINLLLTQTITITKSEQQTIYKMWHYLSAGYITNIQVGQGLCNYIQKIKKGHPGISLLLEVKKCR